MADYYSSRSSFGSAYPSPGGMPQMGPYGGRPVALGHAPGSPSVHSSSMMSPSMSGVMGSGEADEPTVPFGLKLSHGVYSIQGKRPTMEDAHFIGEPNSDYTGFFGLYDGHGGTTTSEFLADKLHENVYAKGLTTSDMEATRQKIVEAFAETEQEVINLPTHDSGSTAVVAMFLGTKLVMCNVGDSEAVLARKHKPVVVTTIHTPKKNPREFRRVFEAGGTCSPVNMTHPATGRESPLAGRLKHPKMPLTLANLAVSRAFGDILFKLDRYTKGAPSGLIADPSLREIDITTNDEFLILACDGVWDVVTYQMAVRIVRGELERSGSPQQAAMLLVNSALELGSTDNISAIIIKFEHLTKAQADAARGLAAAASPGHGAALSPAGSGSVTVFGETAEDDEEGPSSSADTTPSRQAGSPAAAGYQTPPRASARPKEEHEFCAEAQAVIASQRETIARLTSKVASLEIDLAQARVARQQAETNAENAKAASVANTPSASSNPLSEAQQATTSAPAAQPAKPLTTTTTTTVVVSHSNKPSAAEHSRDLPRVPRAEPAREVYAHPHGGGGGGVMGPSRLRQLPNQPALPEFRSSARSSNKNRSQKRHSHKPMGGGQMMGGGGGVLYSSVASAGGHAMGPSRSFLAGHPSGGGAPSYGPQFASFDTSPPGGGSSRRRSMGGRNFMPLNHYGW